MRRVRVMSILMMMMALGLILAQRPAYAYEYNKRYDSEGRCFEKVLMDDGEEILNIYFPDCSAWGQVTNGKGNVVSGQWYYDDTDYDTNYSGDDNYSCSGYDTSYSEDDNYSYSGYDTSYSEDDNYSYSGYDTSYSEDDNYSYSGYDTSYSEDDNYSCSDYDSSYSEDDNYSCSGYDTSYSDYDYYADYVAVDITNQRLSCIKNNQIVYSTPVITGMLGISDTPTGVYHIQNKYSGDGEKLEIKKGFFSNYWMSFNGAYGIHDAPWRQQQQFDADGTYRENGSLGCINIPNDQIGELYNLVEVGTEVRIY